MKLAVIQHSPWEGPGRYLLQAAKINGIEICIIKAWEQNFPATDDFAGFLLLGGSANIDEDGKYPFLSLEKKYIKTIIEKDKPCLGICLGHQLLANSLGAEVGQNFCYSIGAGKALLTKDGRNHPLFKDMQKSFPTFKWHGQAVLLPLPKQFEILATSTECQVEAFSIKGHSHFIGVQFDNHAAHPNEVAMWYNHDKDWLNSIETFSMPLKQILDEIKAVKDEIERDFQQFFTSFCNFL